MDYCTKCVATFASPEGLRFHEQTVHGDHADMLAARVSRELAIELAAVESKLDAYAQEEVCLGCGHVGPKPPPPAISCCPERRTVRRSELASRLDAAQKAADSLRETLDALARKLDKIREKCAAGASVVVPDYPYGNGYRQACEDVLAMLEQPK